MLTIPGPVAQYAVANQVESFYESVLGIALGLLSHPAQVLTCVPILRRSSDCRCHAA